MLARLSTCSRQAAVSGYLSKFDYTDFAIDNMDLEVNGDLAFARGTYAASPVVKSGGDPVAIQGKYMTILRQKPDGSWKISHRRRSGPGRSADTLGRRSDDTGLKRLLGFVRYCCGVDRSAQRAVAVTVWD